jgi:hypothetical protein
MSSGELKIDCPCCKAKLVVDAASGGVLQAVPFKEAPQSLESFLKADQSRAKDLEDKFAESRRIEESRLAMLEKKFEWAKKNKDKLPDAPKPGIQWD